MGRGRHPPRPRSLTYVGICNVREAGCERDRLRFNQQVGLQAGENDQTGQQADDYSSQAVQARISRNGGVIVRPR